MRKMRSSGQTPGSFRQVLLILSFLAAGTLVSCLQEEVPPPPTILYGSQGDALRQISGLEDLPPPEWTPVESSHLPTGFLNRQGTGIILLNRRGLATLSLQGGGLQLSLLGPPETFSDRQLLDLWTWEEKIVVSSRALTPLEEKSALTVWYPESRSYLPLPLPTQIGNSGYRLVEAAFSDLTWDFLWSHPQGFAASRFYPGSGVDELWNADEFLKTHEPLNWELVPEPYRRLTNELGPSAALLKLEDLTPRVYRKVGSAPSLMVWGGTGPSGAFLLSETGRLIIATPEGGVKEVLGLPSLPALRYRGALSISGGLAAFWQLERGSLRSHWGIVWIPHR